MTYLLPSLGCASRRCGAGAAMGDTGPADGGSVSALVDQVNRFGPGAPFGYQFVTEPFTAPPEPFGIRLLPISVGLATIALTIYQRRATDAYNQFHDNGSQQAIAAANAGFADPVTFVSGHLAQITSTLQAFADSLGIPATSGAPSEAQDGISTGTLAIAALAAWWLLR